MTGGEHLRAGRRPGGTTALLSSPLCGKGVKSQIRSNLVVAGQKVRETGRTLRIADPPSQRQGEPRGKARVCGQKPLSRRHRYLHETSTPGHQDPLREAAGRTRALLPARRRHLQLSSASAGKRGVRRTEGGTFTTLYDTPRPRHVQRKSQRLPGSPR